MVMNKEQGIVFNLDYLYCLYLIRNEIHIQDSRPTRFDTVCVKRFDDKKDGQRAFDAICIAFKNGESCCEI